MQCKEQTHNANIIYIQFFAPHTTSAEVVQLINVGRQRKISCVVRLCFCDCQFAMSGKANQFYEITNIKVLFRTTSTDHEINIKIIWARQQTNLRCWVTNYSASNLEWLLLSLMNVVGIDDDHTLIVCSAYNSVLTFLAAPPRSKALSSALE